jgi:hypothetical protein
VLGRVHPERARCSPSSAPTSFASTLRARLGSGIPPRELAPVLGVVYLVDVLLSPIGFMAVLASEDHPYAYLLAVPPGGLRALIAHERRRRIEHELSLGRAYRRSTRGIHRRAGLVSGKPPYRW